MLSSIKGKSVIVTGGSKGIGLGIARVFVRQGAKLTIASRGKEAGEAAVKHLNDVGGTARWAECDVSDWDSVRGMVDAAASAQAGLNIMCANAGMFPQTKMVDMDVSEWDTVINTNLKSTFLSVKASIPHFDKAGKGRVVVTSSITGPITGFPGWTHYGASKSGQLGFLKTAAMELSRYNTTINAVMPGDIYTEGRLIPLAPVLQDVECSALPRALFLYCSCHVGPPAKPTDRCLAKRSTRVFATRTPARSIWRTGAGRRASSAPLAPPARAGR